MEIELQKLNTKIDNIQNVNDSLLAKKNSDLRNSSAKQANEQKTLNSKVENVSEILMNDLNNLSPNDIANKWVNIYNKLPKKYQNMVETENGTYDMEFGDWYGLNRGFSWGCEKNEKLYQVWEVISDSFGTSDKNKAYKAGMVVQYVRNNIIKCQ